MSNRDSFVIFLLLKIGNYLEVGFSYDYLFSWVDIWMIYNI